METNSIPQNTAPQSVAMDPAVAEALKKSRDFLQKERRSWFEGASLQAGAAKLAEINEHVQRVKQHGDRFNVHQTFDPDSFDATKEAMIIVPLTEKINDARTNVGFVVSVAPTMGYTLDNCGDDGYQFVEALFRSRCQNTTAGVQARREKGKPNTPFPRTFEDYRGPKRHDRSGWEHFAPEMVSWIDTQARGSGSLNVKVLELCLSSTAYAQTMLSNFTPAHWQRVFSILRGALKAENFDTALVDHWEATRDEQSIDLANDISLDDLDALDSLLTGADDGDNQADENTAA